MPPPRLYAYPFSSYCQRVLVALYELDAPFEYRHLESPGAMDELARRWPMKEFPQLLDGERTVIEATGIIEHLQRRHPERHRLTPDDPHEALEVRQLDRFLDNCVSTRQHQAVYDRQSRRQASGRERHAQGARHAWTHAAPAWAGTRSNAPGHPLARQITTQAAKYVPLPWRKRASLAPGVM